MTDEPKLLPCPFCGSGDIRVHQEPDQGKAGWQVYCVDCHNGTSIDYTQADYAIPAWNNRAPDPERDALAQHKLKQAEEWIAARHKEDFEASLEVSRLKRQLEALTGDAAVEAVVTEWRKYIKDQPTFRLKLWYKAALAAARDAAKEG